MTDDNYLIDRVKDLAGRIEEALRKLETRTEQTIELREQMATVQRVLIDIKSSLSAVWELLRGSGIDRPGLQQQLFAQGTRLDALEECLLHLEADVGKLIAASSAVTVEDRKGEWALKVETRKQKLMFLAAITCAALASSPLWRLAQWLFDKLVK